MTTEARPAPQDHELVRSEEIQRLFDQEVVNNTTARQSRSIATGAFRRFALYVRIKSTSTPTTLQVKVQFLERWSGLWHDLDEGLFASLYYEDTVTATERLYTYTGLCAGRDFRVEIVGAGTTSSAYFTVSVAVEFFN